MRTLGKLGVNHLIDQMTPRNYYCYATSRLDRATCFGVVMGGERERGATEGTLCQI